MLLNKGNKPNLYTTIECILRGSSKTLVQTKAVPKGKLGSLEIGRQMESSIPTFFFISSWNHSQQSFFFLHWPHCLMFFMLLATMYFHFVLAITILLNTVPNRFKISSSHRRSGLPNSRFRSFGYHSSTARVYLLFVSLATCPAQRIFCFGTPRSRPSLHSVPELIHFGWTHTTIF